MKQIFVVVILGFIWTSCQSSTDLRLDVNSVKKYSILNNYLLKSEKFYKFIKEPSVLMDQNIKEAFIELESDKKLICILYSDKELIFYKIEEEKFTPFIGTGLQYFSHYLIYTSNKKPDFNKIFENDFELEEKFYQSREINENWYYVIGEHSSD